MALLAKLFANRFPSSGATAKQNSDWKEQTASFKNSVHLLVYRDHDLKGRHLVLDSRCIQKVTLEDLLCEKCLKVRLTGRRGGCRLKNQCSTCSALLASPKNFPKYRNICNSNKNDTKLLGEMIFGTAPLTSSGYTLKVHCLKNPNQLMLSTAFSFNQARESGQCLDFDQLSVESFESAVYTMRRSDTLTSSIPVDTPSSGRLWGSDTSLSGSVASSGSPGASVVSINSTSKLSMMRRLRKSRQFNLPNSNRSSYEETQSQSSEPGAPLLRCRSSKIGLAVMFTQSENEALAEQFETFFFSSMILIEGQLVKLRKVIEQSAGLRGPVFTERIMEALEQFERNVLDLYSGPRMPSPVWLNMMASTSRRYMICDRFVKEFAVLVDRYDSKATNYFLSSVLTGVLMYHLAWVPTVTPSGAANTSFADKHTPKWLDMLAKSHPYNPLWAQLSDLYGAIGIPSRLARTIVVGKKKDIVQRFLFILSYFIRCSEIHESMEECFDDNYVIGQLQSAADEEATGFVVVQPQETLPRSDLENNSDSGLVSQYTGNSKTAPLLPCSSGTDDESGFTELHASSFFSAVDDVPSSLPADRVRAWINSELNADKPTYAGTEINPAVTCKTLISPTIHKSGTDSTIANSPRTHSVESGSAEVAQCLESSVPPAERIERLRPVGRCAIDAISDDNVIGEFTHESNKTSSNESEKTVTGMASRANLVRLFSAEIEEFNEYFDGNPPSFSRQLSNQSNSMFNEYFEDDINVFESCSQCDDGTVGSKPEASSSVNSKRDVLFKVAKELGFHSNTPASSDQEQQPRLSAANTNVKRTTDYCSSRCSTPQTVKCGVVSATETRCRNTSACQTIKSDDGDPFDSFKELAMPRSKDVNKLADTSISTTSFGRMLLGGYSDHYLADFVLHGTSDDSVTTKVQADLVASVQHSVLEDPITEAVCLVADTDKWTVCLCSSMREQPKDVTASQLVVSMVESANLLSKLKMSPEFTLMQMEDRLQEMYFKSRMLAEYIGSRKKVDMDELNAMFGLDISDIRFLLSVAGTHSNLNVHGIF